MKVLGSSAEQGRRNMRMLSRITYGTVVNSGIGKIFLCCAGRTVSGGNLW